MKPLMFTCAVCGLHVSPGTYADHKACRITLVNQRKAALIAGSPGKTLESAEAKRLRIGRSTQKRYKKNTYRWPE